MNASDTRGKKALENEIKESLSNVTVNGMLEGDFFFHLVSDIGFLCVPPWVIFEIPAFLSL